LIHSREPTMWLAPDPNFLEEPVLLDIKDYVPNNVNATAPA
jgi:hypothetical protein